MDKFFQNPALKTKINSSGVKIQEMLIGYFLAPLCAMMANSIFSAYLTRYYADVIGLTVPKMKVVRIGIVGLGMRGPGAVYRLSNIEGTEIVALCDVEPNRVEAAQEILKKNNRKPAASYSGSAEAYKKMCERNDIDLVYICTDWVHHVPIALYAMEHGKNVAIEVPAATSLDEIWALINMSEKTRKHCMMLENCCYDFFEMSCLSMAQAGVFGEVLHVEGAYLHSLDEYWDRYWNNWRLDFNRTHKGDVYPTHGLGPVAQVLNIHRGDRFKTLVAMETKPVNGPAQVKRQTGEECTDFQNGDEVNTMILTEKGKTILISHDVLTPRPYNRMYQIVGTEGYAAKYPVQQIMLSPHRSLSPETVPFLRRTSRRCRRNTATLSSPLNLRNLPRRSADTAEWTSSWTTASSTASGTAFLWTWTYMTWLNGAAWANSEPSRSKTVACRWKYLTSPGAPGTK